MENSTLKVAVEKALLFLEKNELPPHWDRDSLFGHSVSSGNSDSDAELDSDVRFYIYLYFSFLLAFFYENIFYFSRVQTTSRAKRKIILWHNYINLWMIVEHL